MKLVIDIEANNLLFDVSKIWCIVAYDLDTDTTYTFEPDEIDKALALLSKAEVLIGHNIVGYDLPAIKKLNPTFTYKGEVIDTLILSRLRYPQLGSHSLKAWGERLKFPKDEHTDFSYYSPEMLTYCVQDVKVSTKLYKILADKIDPSQPFVKLEQNVLAIQTKAEMYGVGFKYDDAVKLIQQIDAEMAQIAEDIAPILGINTVEYVTKLKKDGTPNVHASRKITLGYDYKIEDEKCIVFVTEPITLDEKKLLTEKLLSLGWKPTMYTDKGTPRIADKGEACPNLSTIEGVPDTVGKYFVLKHRRSLIDGMLRTTRSQGR
jgi:DNA polymerase III epsilon subunit-like protein